MKIREILKQDHIGNNTLDGAVSDVIAWSDARCSNKGKLTAELVAEIHNEIIAQYSTVREFTHSYWGFTEAYLSNIKKGKMQRITNKVILLCEILEIKISEYTII